MRDLQADRIGHGVRSIEDPHLLAWLYDRQIPLEVNPTSNVCLGIYRSIEQHPVIHLLRMGLCATVNSDDPPLFNTTLTEEYQRLAETFGLTEDDLQRLTLNAVRATFLPAEEKQRMEEEFAAQFQQLRSATP